MEITEITSLEVWSRQAYSAHFARAVCLSRPHLSRTVISVMQSKRCFNYYVLYCTVLLVLYWNVLYCTVLYCTVLYCTILYCSVLYCTVLHCTVPNCTVLYCIVLSKHANDSTCILILSTTGLWIDVHCMYRNMNKNV